MGRKEMIAMLLAGGQGSRLGVLTSDVAKPAVAFGGKYRIIDFPLSNCINSGIDTVGVLTQYQPFASEAVPAAGPVFRLRVAKAGSLPRPEGLTEVFRQDDDGSRILLSRTADGESWFEFDLAGKTSAWLRVAPPYREAVVTLHHNPVSGLNNAMMVLYALSTARLATALFHAAVIVYKGRGYLFLGKSGTGKSTHARLWLEHIPGSELLNDDNPVVRILNDGSVRVYGSPWSGKTPCYRNIDVPAGAFVQLSQAPYNAIRRLNGISAYVSLVSSISGMRWEPSLADGLHETENLLVAGVPAWHLECLPDEAAAQLCSKTIRKA